MFGRRRSAMVSHTAYDFQVNPGQRATPQEERIMANGTRTPGDEPIKVGVIAEQTGPLSFMGLANANVARMVIGDLNARGGLLGRHLELHLEDGATDDAVAAAAATKLVQEDQV